MPERVKAAVLEAPRKLSIREFPYPSQIEPGALVASMVLAGICGTDKHIFEGRSSVQFPVILGHENLAIVERMSSKVYDVYGEELKPGDRITWFGAIPCGECWYCRWIPSNHVGILCEKPFAYGQTSCEEPPHLFGGYAEKVYIKPKAWIWKIPASLPDEVAVLVDIFASVGGIIKAMTPAPVLKEGFGPGDWVVIQGSGPIGIAAGITAKLAGAYKILLIGAPKKRLETIAQLNVFDEFINIEEVKNKEERVRIVKKWTPGGVGADLVVDCTGVPDAVPEGLEMVRRGGSFVEIGSFVETGETRISPFRHICWRDVQIYGQYGCSPQYYEKALRLLEMAWKGGDGIPLQKIVHTFPLEAAAEAMAAAGRLEYLKIALDMRSGYKS